MQDLDLFILYCLIPLNLWFFSRYCIDMWHNYWKERDDFGLIFTSLILNLLKFICLIYRILIHACALVGYTNKAFKLHREFKARGLPFHVGIYTDLFSACTRSHNPVYAREKAKQLLNEIREKHINPNRVSPYFQIYLK